MAKANRLVVPDSQALAFFFDQTPDLLCVADKDGYFLSLNPAWEQVLGYSRDELRARPFSDFVHPDDRQRTRAETLQVSQDQGTRLFENRYLHKDGHEVWLNWNSVRDPATGLIYAIARDISDRVHEERNRARMFHNLAHDMAMPISVVHHVTTATEPKDVSHEHWALLVRAGQRLMGLLGDVRDIGRISEHSMRLRMEDVDLAAVAQGVVADLHHVAKDKDVRVVVDAVPCTVRGDGQRLARVITNLIHNAIKFSPHGAEVTVQVAPGQDGGRVAVIDQGPGVAPEDASRVFQPFSQLDNAHEGTGLGLYICKGIVEAHGGTIGVDSAKGACFWFTVPFQ